MPWLPHAFEFIYTDVPVDTELGNLQIVPIPQVLAAVGRTDFRQTK